MDDRLKLIVHIIVADGPTPAPGGGA